MHEREKWERCLLHPYLLLILGCLLLYILFPQGSTNNVLDARTNGCLAALLVSGCICLYLWRQPAKKKQVTENLHFDSIQVLICICIAVCAGCLFFIYCSSQYQLEMLALLVLLTLAGIGIWLQISHRLTARRACMLLGAAALVLRAVYILYTSYLTRQHDVYPVNQSLGHQAYILYFVNHNFALPDFDPTSVWEFYHPPLHYFLSALWVKLQMLFGTDTAVAIENVQFLTLFYSCAAVLVCYRILRALHFDGSALTACFAILCFHPSLILLAGSINNDMLCILLSLAAILYAIRWYQNPTLKNILLLAACIGFAMMSKSSGVLVAPAVAVVFLIKLLKTKTERKALWQQFGAFLAVCAPLGLWWTVYCKLRFGVPVGALTALTPDNPQYIGGFSISQRFFGIDWQHLSVFENWDWQNHVFEYNLLFALLKTSLFDEAKLFTEGAGLFCARILFWSNLLLIAASLVCMAVTAVFAVRGSETTLLRQKKYLHRNDEEFLSYTVRMEPYKLEPRKTRIMVLFFAVLYITFLGFYVWFCFSQPYACTQSFRYIIPTVLIGAAGVGSVLERTRLVPTRGRKIITWALSLLCTVFCFFSTVVYLLAGAFPAQ